MYLLPWLFVYAAPGFLFSLASFALLKKRPWLAEVTTFVLIAATYVPLEIHVRGGFFWFDSPVIAPMYLLLNFVSSRFGRAMVRGEKRGR